MKINTTTFYGNKVSQYGIEHNRVDYATLAKSFDCILNNDIMANTYEVGYWELINGVDYDIETDTFVDIFQYYIVSDFGASLLEQTDEIVYYNETLDMYIWGITHYGTCWEYVLTDIEIEVAE